MNKYVRQLYEELLDKFPKSALLKISYSLFLIQHLKNILAAYKYFNSAEGGCNLSEQFQIYVAKKFLKDEIKNKNLYRNHIIPQSESYAKYDKKKTINKLQFSPDYECILLYEQKMHVYSKWVMSYLDKQ